MNQPDVKNYIYAGLIIIVIFFVGFGAWAALAPLHTASVSQGFIIVESERKTVRHLEGGIVKSIFIKEGSVVKKGDPLIKLDETQSKAQMISYREELAALLAEEARLIAERDNKDEIIFSKVLLDRKDDPSILKIINGQIAIFESNTTTFKKNIEALQDNIKALENEVARREAQTEASKKQLLIQQKEIDAYKALLVKHYVSRNDIWKLETIAARTESEIRDHEADGASAKHRISQTRLQIITDTNKRFNDIVTDLRRTQRDIIKARESYDAAKDVFTRTDITAPMNGTVVNLQVHTIGSTIRPNEDLMDIVPKGDRLVIQAQISPNDIDTVRDGLPALIRLTAYPGRTTPTLNGTVLHVSADTLKNEKTGAYYYDARVLIDAKELSQLKRAHLYPGMPVQVMIITENRTVLNYIFSPIMDSLERAFRED